MLINRWKKDKDKDKSSNSSQHNSSGGSSNVSSSSSSSKSNSMVKKKRKAGKEGKMTMTTRRDDIGGTVQLGEVDLKVLAGGLFLQRRFRQLLSCYREVLQEFMCRHDECDYSSALSTSFSHFDARHLSLYFTSIFRGAFLFFGFFYLSVPLSSKIYCLGTYFMARTARAIIG